MNTQNTLGFVCWFLATVCLTGSAMSDTFDVNFEVVDADGKPVAEAQLSTRWIVDSENENPFQAVFDSKATTDSDGKCKINFNDQAGETQVLLGYSKDKKLSGMVIVEKQDEGETLKIKLEPVITVKAKYYCSETDSPPRWTNTIISIEDVRAYLFEFRCKDGNVEFPLPSGQWKARMYGTGIVKKCEEFETKSSQPIYDFKTVDFEATPIERLKGKPAPKISILNARGLKKDFQLADLKGKWVLLEFWGYW